MWRLSIFITFLTISRSIVLEKLPVSSEENERTPLEMSFEEFLNREADRETFRRVRQVPLAALAGVGMMPGVGVAGVAPMVGMPMSGGMSAQEIASLPAILNQLKIMTESVLRTQQQQSQGNGFANTWSNSWGGMSPMTAMGAGGGYMAQPYAGGVYPGPRPEPHPEPIPVGYNPFARTSMNLNFNLAYNSGCGRNSPKYPMAGGMPMSGYAVGATGHSFGQGGYAQQPQSCPEPEPEPEPVAPVVVPLVAQALPVNSYNRAAMPMLPQPPMGPMFAADVKQAATPFVPHLNATEVTQPPDIIEATSAPVESAQQDTTSPTTSQSSQ